MLDWGPNLSRLVGSNYVESCRVTTAIVPIHRVSQNYAFYRYAHITSHYKYPFTPLKQDFCLDCPFLLIRKITHISTNMMIVVLDCVG